MSQDEKETYFDGPHMSSGDSQLPSASLMNQRMPPFDGMIPTPGNHEPHSSGQNSGIAPHCEGEPGTSGSPKTFPSNSIYVLNGGETINGNPPAEHLTSPPLSTQSYNCQLYAPESAPSTSMPNNNSAFNQTTAIHDQFAVMAKQGLGADTPLIPVVSMPEAPATSQPMGTYMNIAYSVDQNFVAPEIGVNSQLVPPSEPVVDPNIAGAINIRSSDAVAYDNDFAIHPGPSYTQHLHQDHSEELSHRNAEDILHSQGSYSAQNYETSTSAYVVPLPNPPQGEGSSSSNIREDNNQANLVMSEIDLSQAMNNLAISDQNPPIKLEELNIKDDLDDSPSTTTDDDFDGFNEKIIVKEDDTADYPVQDVMISQSQIVVPAEAPSYVPTSSLHSPLDRESAPSDIQSISSTVLLHENPISTQSQDHESNISQRTDKASSIEVQSPDSLSGTSQVPPVALPSISSATSSLSVLSASTTSLRSQMGVVHTVQASSPPVDDFYHQSTSNCQPTAVTNQITPPNQSVPLSQASHPPVDAFYHQAPSHFQPPTSAAQFEPPTRSVQAPGLPSGAQNNESASHSSISSTHLDSANQTVQASHPPADAFYHQTPSHSQPPTSTARFEPPTQSVQAPSLPSGTHYNESASLPTASVTQVYYNEGLYQSPASTSATQVMAPSQATQASNAQLDSLHHSQGPYQSPASTSSTQVMAPSQTVQTSNPRLDSLHHNEGPYQSPASTSATQVMVPSQTVQASTPQPDSLHHNQGPPQPDSLHHNQGPNQSSPSTSSTQVMAPSQSVQASHPHADTLQHYNQGPSLSPASTATTQVRPPTQAVQQSQHSLYSEQTGQLRGPSHSEVEHAAVNHVHPQATNVQSQSASQYAEQNRHYSSYPRSGSDSNFQRRNQSLTYERKSQTQQRSRPSSSMSGYEYDYSGGYYDQQPRGDYYRYGSRRDERYYDYYQRYDRNYYDPRYQNRYYVAYDYNPYYSAQQYPMQNYYERVQQQYNQWDRDYRANEQMESIGHCANCSRHQAYENEGRARYSNYYRRQYQHRNILGYQDPNSLYAYGGDQTVDDSYYPSLYETKDPLSADPPSVSQQDSALARVSAEPVVARLTPAKFRCPHPIARFGPGGQLLMVTPQKSVAAATTTVQIHGVEILFSKNKEAQNLKNFPGPLSMKDTHKNDVDLFIASKSRNSKADLTLIDRFSTSLMWDFLRLMVRQNGAVMGTDISELLMRDHHGDFGLLASPNERRLMQIKAPPRENGSDETAFGPQENGESVPRNDENEQIVNPTVRFRELLLYGRKKDALEWAMKSDLWGHALLLACKTDARTHATVMLRFANSLPINDPLQTLYQLMSGRQPASTTCIADEGWGDWRPHLAMILSNSTENASFDAKLLLTMGDTLANRGLIDAAHFCYLMASVPLSFYNKKTNKLVLLGADHKLPFKRFALNDAIERTETYEYAVALTSSSTRQGAKVPVHFPPLQIYKFIYACRLLDYGMVAKAFHYFENISHLVIHAPSSYSLTLVSQLSNMVDRLKYHDSRAQAGTLRESDLQWTVALSSIYQKMMVGSIIPSTISYARSSTLSDVASSGILSSHPHLDESPESEQSDTDVGELTKYPAYDDKWQQEPQSHGQQTAQPAIELNQSSVNYGAVPQQAPDNVHPNIAQVISPVAPPAAVPLVPVDAELSQAIVAGMTQPLQNPIMFNPTQFASTPNTSMVPFSQPPQMQPPSQPPQMLPSSQPPQMQPLSQPPQMQPPSQPPQMQPPSQPPQMLPSSQPPQMQPLSQPPQMQPPSQPPQIHPPHAAPYAQHYPPQEHGDIYDHFSSGPAKSPEDSRRRTESQTSFGSRRSRVSRKSSSRRNRTISERSKQSRSRSSSAESAKSLKKKTKGSKPWSIFGWLSRKSSEPKAHRVHLPDDTNNAIQWDPVSERWVDANATEEEKSQVHAPPPMDNPSDPPVRTEGTIKRNKYSLKNLKNPAMYAMPPGGSTKQVENQKGANVPTPMPGPLAATVPGGPPQQPMFNPNQYQGNIGQSLPAPQGSVPPPGEPAPLPKTIPNSIAANEAPAPPPMATFYNPAQFTGGPNLFTQPPAASSQQKRTYPSVKH